LVKLAGSSLPLSLVPSAAAESATKRVLAPATIAYLHESASARTVINHLTSSSASASSSGGASASQAIEEEAYGTESELEKIDDDKSTEVDDDDISSTDDEDDYDWNGDDNTDEEDEPERKKVCAGAPRKASVKVAATKKVKYDDLLNSFREDGCSYGDADIKARATMVWMKCMCAHCGDAPRVPIAWHLMRSNGLSRETMKRENVCKMLVWIDKYQSYREHTYARVRGEFESWLEHKQKMIVDKKYAHGFATGIGRKCPLKGCGKSAMQCECTINDM
jgi:hypothetical protein